ncbi:MAG: ATP-dependent DNA ligase [Steroidobacteraceae bacterium]
MTPLSSLVQLSERIAATSGRLAKVRELATLLRELRPEEIEIAVHYLSGALPQGRFGIGYRTLKTAADEAAAATTTLSLIDADRHIAALATVRGAGSAKRRTEALRALFSLATSEEQRFLIRLMVGELRQGALEGVMVDAIASAAGIPVPQVRRAAMFSGDLGKLAFAALTQGGDSLDRFQLQLFAPVVPMLAQTAADPGEALESLEDDVDFEWKMDGARIQVHKGGDEVRIYTRALNEVTDAIPEIVDAVRALPVRDAILDGEVIAFTEAGRPHAFPVTMRRFGRKLEVERMKRELPLRAYFFDCLRVDDRAIPERPLRERLVALDAFVPEPMRIPRLVTASVAEADTFYAAAIDAGHEGIMAKALDSPYEAGNRGASWLKIKRAHTLDLVVLAAEWGHGRRTGKLSNLHLGAFDAESGEYAMLGKTFKGLTDAMLEWQTRELLARETHRTGITVHVRPEIVAEIAFSDLQASSRYPGGLALRLARVKRFRDDKSVTDADTMATVRQIFAAQG